jgi:large subunit ribosomal protein L30
VAKKSKKIRITLIKSALGRKPNQRKTVRALGLRKMQSTVVKEVSPAIEGMVKKVAHLVKVEEIA